MKTIISKNPTWTATTFIDHGDRTIRLSTHKSSFSSKLVTSATVGESKDGSFTFMMFQDYSKTIITETVRCTEKNVTQQHQSAIDMIEAIKQDVTKFYSKVPA